MNKPSQSKIIMSKQGKIVIRSPSTHLVLERSLDLSRSRCLRLSRSLDRDRLLWDLLLLCRFGVLLRDLDLPIVDPALKICPRKPPKLRLRRGYRGTPCVCIAICSFTMALLLILMSQTILWLIRPRERYAYVNGKKKDQTIHHFILIPYF